MSSADFLPNPANSFRLAEQSLTEPASEALAPQHLFRLTSAPCLAIQGIEPPSPRGEEFCDAATKTHINDNPAYYYNYAFATVFKFQLHDYIARKILHQPPQSCNYADNKEVGAWLNNILKKGGTEDWRKVLKEATGEDISTRAMMDYFKPLMAGGKRKTKAARSDGSRWIALSSTRCGTCLENAFHLQHIIGLSYFGD